MRTMTLLFAMVCFTATGASMQGRRPKPHPHPKPSPSPTPTPTPVPTPTPTPLVTPTPSPTPSQFHVDDFGRVTATSYNTHGGDGAYRIGGQAVLRYDSFLTNFACGKVSNLLSFPGQQNFMCGNVVAMPSGSANTAFGWDTGRPTTGSGNTFFGHDAGLGISTGNYNVFIGMHSGPFDQAGSVQTTGSIGIGAGARVTGDNQLLIGGVIPIKDAYLGSGVASVSPAAVTLQTTGGSGADNRGAAFTLAAGRSTGSATPASLFFATSAATTSGTTAQPLINRWEIDGQGTLKALNGSVVKAGVQLADGGAKPPCTVTTRGRFWPTFGPDGVGDSLEVCMKSASGIYAYRVVLFPQ